MDKLEKIASGTYGILYTANDRKNGNNDEIFAIKRNLKDSTASWINNLRELNFLSSLKGHPYIVDLISISYDDPFVDGTSREIFSPLKKNYNNDDEDENNDLIDDNIHFIMEYVPHSGNNFFRNKTLCTFDVAKTLACQLLLGVEYIHDKLNLMHRDLKPSNVLISQDEYRNYVLKICDFGMSQVVSENCESTPNIATWPYRSLEICMKDPNYGQKIDLWAIGCTIIEMFSKVTFISLRTPDKSNKIILAILENHPDPPCNYILRRLKKYRPKLVIPDYILKKKPSNFLELMKIPEYKHRKYSLLNNLLYGLLNLDDRERFTAFDALKSPFFQDHIDLIDDIRRKFPPEPEVFPVINIINCPERERMILISNGIYNTKEKFIWYSDRILFHAIDLFDRYLEKIKKDKNLTNNEVDFHFYICLYMIYKNFTSMQVIISWNDFSNDKYISDSFFKQGEEFEKYILEYIIKNNDMYEVHRQTVYERRKDEDISVRNLLDQYGKVKFKGGSVRRMYNQMVENYKKEKKEKT